VRGLRLLPPDLADEEGEEGVLTITVGDTVRIRDRSVGTRRAKLCDGRVGRVAERGLDTGHEIYRVEVEGVRARYWFLREELKETGEPEGHESGKGRMC
jgi:hypothetical protein